VVRNQLKKITEDVDKDTSVDEFLNIVKALKDLNNEIITSNNQFRQENEQLEKRMKDMKEKEEKREKKEKEDNQLDAHDKKIMATPDHNGNPLGDQTKVSLIQSLVMSKNRREELEAIIKEIKGE